MGDIKRFHAFSGFGIELEFALVQARSLAIRSVADLVLEELAGKPSPEISRKGGGWSKELARHVIELKTNGVSADLMAMKQGFQQELHDLQPVLAHHDATFLGCGMHPLMKPSVEGELWPDDDREIYEAYDRIFDCRGHGWVNLQSIHINLPFYDDAEFGRLHAAVRLVLPLLPVLAASSPIVEGQFAEIDDNRLAYYIKNQRQIPEITGPLIPEAVWTKQDYEKQVLQRTYQAIQTKDPQGILQEEWLNSRGAIARFDRQAIEIRLLDKQESLTADFALVAAVIGLVKAMYEETWSPLSAQKQMSTERLRNIFDEQLLQRSNHAITDLDFLQLFGLQESCQAKDLWRHVKSDLESPGLVLAPMLQDLDTILNEGNFSQRLRRHLPGQPTVEEILEQYHVLPGLSQTGGFYR
ncbi:MAG: glutamate-cysteine ligase family protein [Oligoflexus sp.]